ncbi:ABC transporter permease [Roseivirga sp. E12]|uniref:ABC transporter permease n=1 Tax=Roseivirga sp. E12 TaxID=2819237 RepID=UPI001ABC0E3E|nr:ABC transporter permease [Roseivirga sp. E12]MBO3699789.1 ABC transporter permease [Roseivirga sp. E12]
MVKNILKTALRVFWKERGYALLNVLGLTVGIASATLLLLYVQGEKSMNKFHQDIGSIYQVFENQHYGNTVFTTTANPGPLKDAIKAQMPEVDYMAQFTWEQERLFILADQSFKEKGRIASSDFFQIFDVDFIEGEKENSLSQPDKVYISQSLKERLFGTETALGQVVTINGWGEHSIGGVFENVPNNSSLQFDFVMPYDPWAKTNTWLEDWGNNGVRGLIKLQPNVSVTDFNKKVKSFIRENSEGSNIDLFLQNYGETYLYSNYEDGIQSGGRIVYVRLFMAVAFFILIIASINFMNLATARSTKRAKEVGVKKVVGSSRRLLIFQFMGESILMALISSLVAMLLILLVLPALNELIGRNIEFSLTNGSQVTQLVGIGLSVGLLAGLYPSLLLSGFSPIQVLKGTFRISGWSQGVRKGLVVFQFLVSTFLIIATLVIHQQMSFIKSKNLGYKTENIIYIPLEGELRNPDKQEILLSQIKDNPNFSNSSLASNAPISISTSTSGGYRWEGKADSQETLFNVLQVGHNFIETLDMEIIEGRSFDPNLQSDTAHVIINEQTALKMNVENPLNHPVTFWGRQGKVIGIVKDFHFSSLHTGIEPIVISLRPESSEFAFVKISGGQTAENISYLEGIVKTLNPNYPFTYRFLDESYDQLYRSENTIGQLANYFSIIAIFISLLGLFGLASFAAEQRIKEIGIRKVLGAGLIHLCLTMTKGFAGLVALGFLIASPLAYFFMSDWLNAFEYRVNIGASVFLIAGAASILITVLTVSYHSLKAVYANPVKSLRYE